MMRLLASAAALVPILVAPSGAAPCFSGAFGVSIIARPMIPTAGQVMNVAIKVTPNKGYGSSSSSVSVKLTLPEGVTFVNQTTKFSKGSVVTSIGQNDGNLYLGPFTVDRRPWTYKLKLQVDECALCFVLETTVFDMNDATCDPKAARPLFITAKRNKKASCTDPTRPSTVAPVYVWHDRSQEVPTLPGNKQWGPIGCDASLSTILAGEYGGSLYLSKNGGDSWIDLSATVGNFLGTYLVFNRAAVSANGRTLIAGTGDDPTDVLALSLDGGATWTGITSRFPDTGPFSWYGLAVSDDGTKIAAASDTKEVWFSNDSGATWTDITPASQTPPNRKWFSLSGNADLSVLVLGEGNQKLLFTTTNSGASWTQRQGTGGLPTGVIWWTSSTDNSGTSMVDSILCTVVAKYDRSSTKKKSRPPSSSLYMFFLSYSSAGGSYLLKKQYIKQLAEAFFLSDPHNIKTNSPFSPNPYGHLYYYF